jgi:hypothetical protein
MPAQQGLRTNEERLPTVPIQKAVGRGKKDAILLLKTRTSDLATKNRQLVSEHHDLSCLNSRERGRSTATASARRNNRYTSDTNKTALRLSDNERTRGAWAA